MTISKTASGTWRVRVDVGSGSRRVRKSATFKSKREAQIYEAHIKEQFRQNKLIKEEITLKRFIEDIYVPTKAREVRHHTLRAYKRDIKKILPAIGDKKIHQIARRDVEDLISSCGSYKVAKNARDTLRQILNLAMLHEYVNRNVAAQEYRLPERKVYPQDHNGTWLTTFEEIDDFIESIENDELKLIACLGLNLGLRRGELFALDWEDIDLNERLVYVTKTYVREQGGYKILPPKTKESVRVIPLRKKWVGFLKERQSSGAVIDRAFIPDRYAIRLKQYLAENDLKDVTMLNMRHSFATACINAGMDITKVSRMLGHTNIQTTVARYVRHKVDDILNDFDELGL